MGQGAEEEDKLLDVEMRRLEASGASEKKEELCPRFARVSTSPTSLSKLVSTRLVLDRYLIQVRSIAQG